MSDNKPLTREGMLGLVAEAKRLNEALVFCPSANTRRQESLKSLLADHSRDLARAVEVLLTALGLACATESRLIDGAKLFVAYEPQDYIDKVYADKQAAAEAGEGGRG